jgi:DNA-binding MarR family transcriptional regulator
VTELISVLAPASSDDSAPATGWIDDCEQHSWRSLIVGVALLVDRLDQDLRREHQISFDEYAILAAVSEHPEGTTVGSIGVTHAVSRPRLVPLLSRMQIAGWIQREVGAWHPESRVVVTANGAALLERAAPAHVAGLREYLLDDVDPEEFRLMGRAFRRMYRKLADQYPC